MRQLLTAIVFVCSMFQMATANASDNEEILEIVECVKSSSHYRDRVLTRNCYTEDRKEQIEIIHYWPSFGGGIKVTYKKGYQRIFSFADDSLEISKFARAVMASNDYYRTRVKVTKGSLGYNMSLVE